MTPSMRLALQALDEAEPHGVLYATAKPQTFQNLNATVAVQLRKAGLIQPAPDYLAGPSKHGQPWILTDKGVEETSHE